MQEGPTLLWLPPPNFFNVSWKELAVRVELFPKPRGDCHTLLMQDSGEDGSLGEVAGTAFPLDCFHQTRSHRFWRKTSQLPLRLYLPPHAPQNCWGAPGA